MRHLVRSIATAGLLLAASAALTAADAQQACMTDWSEAGAVVRREGLVPIERVGRLARDRAAAEIVHSVLCQVENRYVYRLTVRGGHGVLRTLVVDARRPFDP